MAKSQRRVVMDKLSSSAHIVIDSLSISLSLSQNILKS